MNILVEELKSGDHFRFRGRDYLCIVNVRKDGQELAVVTARNLGVANQYSVLFLCRGSLVRWLQHTDSFTLRRLNPLPKELTKAVEKRTRAIMEKDRNA